MYAAQSNIQHYVTSQDHLTFSYVKRILELSSYIPHLLHNFSLYPGIDLYTRNTAITVCCVQHFSHVCQKHLQVQYSPTYIYRGSNFTLPKWTFGVRQIIMLIAYAQWQVANNSQNNFFFQL